METEQKRQGNDEEELEEAEKLETGSVRGKKKKNQRRHSGGCDSMTESRGDSSLLSLQLEVVVFFFSSFFSS